LTDLSATNLRQLLASQAFFEYRFGQRGYAIERTTHGMALPAPPDVMFDFLRGHGLVKGSRRDTIVALIEWCRDNLTHFSGDWSALNLENHWQYRGMPPVSRILDGTVRLYKFAHYTAGCWGTFGFLRAMLRTVGIPVMPERIDGHGLVRFPTEDRYLSHGDDPYNQLFKTMIVPLSGHELLVTRARWDRWYGRNLSAGARARNVGRQVYELARTHLSWRLLHYYCLDQAAGKSRADGAVRGTFNDYFTLRQLEDVQLWERMDAKLAEIGGCPALPDV
jgi:hypothetical protein